MNPNIRNPIHLSRLNSITKYPSIMTYHVLGDKGVLKDELVKPFPNNTKLIATEKIDGTNVRILFAENFTIVGSREEFLWEVHDLIGNPNMGIVDFFKPALFETSHENWKEINLNQNYNSSLIVVYGELYGHKIGAAAKNYTQKQEKNFRLFDVATFDNVDQLIEWDNDKISSWRESGGQNFRSRDDLNLVKDNTGFDLAPVLFELNSNDMPTDLGSTYQMMLNHKQTQVRIDAEEQNNSKSNLSEGIVIRTPNRSHISKLRFEDYEKKNRVPTYVYQ